MFAEKLNIPLELKTLRTTLRLVIPYKEVILRHDYDIKGWGKL